MDRVIKVTDEEIEQLRLLIDSPTTHGDGVPSEFYRRMMMLQRLVDGAAPDPMTAGNNRRWADVFTPKSAPTVVVEIEEGSIAAVLATQPIRLISVDHDTEGADPPALRSLRRRDGEGTEQVWVFEHNVIVGGDIATDSWIADVSSAVEVDRT